MDVPLWMGIATLVVGSGGVGTAFVAIRRAPRENRKMDADTAAVIATTAGKWVMDADDRMEELAAELRAIKANQRQQDELMVVHVRWDRRVIDALEAAGIKDLPQPPPLHLPQTG